MQTFDQALFDLYEAGKISLEEALRNADSVNDLRLAIKLNSKRGRTRDLMADTENMSFKDDDEGVGPGLRMG
jgi:twitching motility protein PilU